MKSVLNSVRNVIDNSDYISIDKEAIRFFCKQNYIPNNIHWLLFSPFDFKSLSIKDQLKFFLILDSISFCYWNQPKWNIQFNNRIFDGSLGLVSAIAKSILKGIPVLNFNFLKNLTLNDFNHIVEDSNDKLVLKEERVNILREVSFSLMNSFESNPIKLIERSNYDASKLLKLILKEFKVFKDDSIYKGEMVYFNKKAQLLVSDINYCLGINGMKTLLNVDKLTACADYKIPFILREYGILNYNKHLRNLVDKKKEIQKRSNEEIEIRAFTIWAIELMKQEYSKYSDNINSNKINDFLWLLSQFKNIKYKPYHLTITNSY